MKLSKKIIIYFASAILFSIFVVSLISNSILNNSFDSYLLSEQESTLEEISEEINQLYKENDYQIYERQISSYASLENLTIKIKNLEDRILYSSDQMHGMGNMHNMHRRMQGYDVNEGEYSEKEFPLYKDDEVVGFIVIGYIDNSYLTESALVFKDTLKIILFVSAVVALIIGIIASIFLSRGLTKPLIKIRDTAVEMQKGNLSERSDPKTNTIEIQELSNSINYLGSTLSKQEDVRKRYASDVSHELRTPISTLKSHIEAIMDGIWEPNQEHLSILMAEINRLSSLVDDLKSSFNSAEHEMVLNKTNFNLSDEVNEIITTYVPILEKENISIEQNIEKDISINMDKNKLKQIIYNLISNSIKYSDKNGNIKISLQGLNKNWSILKIKDNGIGIKEEHLPFLFDRFYRVDESRAKDTGGTGLGLSIAKLIVEAHGGEIEVNSEYGQGTEFIIKLPLV